MILLWILVATIFNSSLALLGAFSLYLKENIFEKLVFGMVAFSAGALLSGAFLHLLHEALHELSVTNAFIFLLAGFCVFFVIERFLHWHHCHKKECKTHPVSWLILIGDAIHNFLDGLIIAASFLVSIPFGIITTVLIAAHEIPQELGNFSVLVFSGMKKSKALLFNFLAQTSCILGALIAFFFLIDSHAIIFLLPFAAGGFIYISASDLIPMLHKEPDLKKSIFSFLLFFAGILFVYAITTFFHFH